MNVLGTRIPALVLGILGIILGYFLAHKGFAIPAPSSVG